MTRLLRLSVFFYAIAYVALAIGFGAHSVSSGESWFSMPWFWLGAFAAAYVVLALGHWISKDPTGLPSARWLIPFWILILSFAAPVFADSFDRSNETLGWLLGLAVLLLYLAASFALNRVTRKNLVQSRLLRRPETALAASISGVVLVLSSLALNTTSLEPGWSSQSNPGWQILVGKAHWITALAHVGTDSLSDPTKNLYTRIYTPAGPVIYFLALVAAILLVVAVAIHHASARRLASSRILAPLASIIGFCGFWIYNDIFWGWHFDLTGWTATLATILWLAASLLALIVLVPLASRPGETWRLQFLLLLQAPLAALDLFCFAQYLDWNAGLRLNILGLPLLMMGLQLMSWSCLILLIRQAAEIQIPAVANGPAVSPATAGVDIHAHSAVQPKHV